MWLRQWVQVAVGVHRAAARVARHRLRRRRRRCCIRGRCRRRLRRLRRGVLRERLRAAGRLQALRLLQPARLLPPSVAAAGVAGVAAALALGHGGLHLLDEALKNLR
jgi:hypothetical protein